MDLSKKYNLTDWLEVYNFMLSFVKYKNIKLVRLTDVENCILEKYGLKDFYTNNGLTEEGLNLLISLHFLFTKLNDDLQFGNKDYYYIVTVGQENIMYCVWNKIENDIKSGIVPQPYEFYESSEISIINRIR